MLILAAIAVNSCSSCMLVLAASCLVCLFLQLAVLYVCSFQLAVSGMCFYLIPSPSCVQSCVFTVFLPVCRVCCSWILLLTPFWFHLHDPWLVVDIGPLCVPSLPNPHTPTHSHTERGEVFSKQSLKFPDVHKSTEKTRGKQKRRDRTRTKSGSGQKQVGDHWQLGWEKACYCSFQKTFTSVLIV